MTYKFQVFDIVVSKRPGYNRLPMVVLGYYESPDGKYGYRMRYLLPTILLVNTEELWPDKDEFHLIEFIDERFVKVWSYPK